MDGTGAENGGCSLSTHIVTLTTTRRVLLNAPSQVGCILLEPELLLIVTAKGRVLLIGRMPTTYERGDARVTHGNNPKLGNTVLLMNTANIGHVGITIPLVNRENFNTL